jgi:hypothetical protein
MTVTYLVQNDDKPDLLFEIVNSAGDPVPLAGSTVDFHFSETGSGILKNTGHTDCEITDEDGGICKYEWASGDLDTVGFFEGELQVTYPNTKVQTVYAKYDFEVRDELDT